MEERVVPQSQTTEFVLLLALPVGTSVNMSNSACLPSLRDKAELWALPYLGLIARVAAELRNDTGL